MATIRVSTETSVEVDEKLRGEHTKCTKASTEPHRTSRRRCLAGCVVVCVGLALVGAAVLLVTYQHLHHQLPRLVTDDNGSTIQAHVSLEAEGSTAHVSALARPLSHYHSVKMTSLHCDILTGDTGTVLARLAFTLDQTTMPAGQSSEIFFSATANVTDVNRARAVMEDTFWNQGAHFTEITCRGQLTVDLFDLVTVNVPVTLRRLLTQSLKISAGRALTYNGGDDNEKEFLGSVDLFSAVARELADTLSPYFKALTVDCPESIYCIRAQSGSSSPTAPTLATILIDPVHLDLVAGTTSGCSVHIPNRTTDVPVLLQEIMTSLQTSSRSRLEIASVKQAQLLDVFLAPRAATVAAHGLSQNSTQVFYTHGQVYNITVDVTPLHSNDNAPDLSAMAMLTVLNSSALIKGTGSMHGLSAGGHGKIEWHNYVNSSNLVKATGMVYTESSEYTLEDCSITVGGQRQGGQGWLGAAAILNVTYKNDISSVASVLTGGFSVQSAWDTSGTEGSVQSSGVVQLGTSVYSLQQMSANWKPLAVEGTLVSATLSVTDGSLHRPARSLVVGHGSCHVTPASFALQLNGSCLDESGTVSVFGNYSELESGGLVMSTGHVYTNNGTIELFGFTVQQLTWESEGELGSALLQGDVRVNQETTSLKSLSVNWGPTMPEKTSTSVTLNVMITQSSSPLEYRELVVGNTAVQVSSTKFSVEAGGSYNGSPGGVEVLLHYPTLPYPQIGRTVTGTAHVYQGTTVNADNDLLVITIQQLQWELQNDGNDVSVITGGDVALRDVRYILNTFTGHMSSSPLDDEGVALTLQLNLARYTGGQLLNVLNGNLKSSLDSSKFNLNADGFLNDSPGGCLATLTYSVPTNGLVGHISGKANIHRLPSETPSMSFEIDTLDWNLGPQGQIAAGVSILHEGQLAYGVQSFVTAWASTNDGQDMSLSAKGDIIAPTVRYMLTSLGGQLSVYSLYADGIALTVSTSLGKYVNNDVLNILNGNVEFSVNNRNLKFKADGFLESSPGGCLATFVYDIPAGGLSGQLSGTADIHTFPSVPMGSFNLDNFEWATSEEGDGGQILLAAALTLNSGFVYTVQSFSTTWTYDGIDQAGLVVESALDSIAEHYQTAASTDLVVGNMSMAVTNSHFQMAAKGHYGEDLNAVGGMMAQFEYPPTPEPSQIVCWGKGGMTITGGASHEEIAGLSLNKLCWHTDGGDGEATVQMEGRLYGEAMNVTSTTGWQVPGGSQWSVQENVTYAGAVPAQRFSLRLGSYLATQWPSETFPWISNVNPQ